MKKKRILIGAVLILAGLVCGGVGIWTYQKEQNAGKEYDDLREEVAVTAEPTETPTPQATPEEEPKTEITSTPVEIPIDFDTLQEKYPEVYAWIRIPGTKIDYPIVQREGDSNYYLNHNLDGKETAEGAIFTQDYNKKDFTDPNTVIYGHNMKNGSMFQGLHDYQDRKFFKENQEVLVYLPDQILHYQIFAAYIYDNRHLLQNFDFHNKEVYQDYLNHILSQKAVDTNIDTSADVTCEDQIITMSTCNGNDNERYLVQAVLISIES